MRGNQWLDPSIAYDNKDLFRAWELLLQAGPAARKTAPIAAICWTSHGRRSAISLSTCAQKMAAAYDEKDAAAFAQAADEIIARIGRDIDSLLACKGEFMLGKWIADAKSWAADKSEAAYYETNARTIVTVWSRPSILVDYAGKQWNNLMPTTTCRAGRCLSTPRSMRSKPARPETARQSSRSGAIFEWKFATTTGSDYAATAQGDAYEMSRAMFRKYAPTLLGDKARD